MTTFNCNTHVHRDGNSTSFTAGDELPDWAIGLVGDHCLVEPAADPVDLTAVEPVPEVAAEPEVPEAEPEKVEPAAEPDFTQPAPPKRGRPRKQV